MHVHAPNTSLRFFLVAIVGAASVSCVGSSDRGQKPYVVSTNGPRDAFVLDLGAKKGDTLGPGASIKPGDVVQVRTHVDLVVNGEVRASYPVPTPNRYVLFFK